MMEEKIAIVTDTASDIQEFPEVLKLTGAEIAHVFVHFKDKSYSTSEINLEEYHAKLANITDKAEWPKTAAPDPAAFLDIYEKLKNKGYTKILSIHVAEKLSGTINAANMAIANAEGMDIELINTQSASIGEIATIIKAHQLLSDNLSFDKIVTKLREFSDHSKIFITLDTLDYLRMGGRISHVKYRIGKLLRMKPILIVAHGVIDSYDKTRKIEKSREKVFYHATKDYSNEEEFNYVIGHTRSLDSALEFETKLREKFPNAKGFVGEIGTAICTHIGPGALGIITFK